MELMNAKGTRDFPPEKKILRQRIVRTLATIFERYGFSPLETPVLERYDILAAKYAGGSEILKETFKLRDQGGRELGLRYDLTVPLARFVGMNPNLKMPFKRYQIGRVFRDGPIKTGRYREFWQCDVDTVGCKGMMADAELLMLASEAFSALNVDAEIKLNNRKLLSSLIGFAGIKENKDEIILSIDKLEKIGREGVLRELEEKGVTKETGEKLLELFSLKSIGEVERALGETEGTAELREILGYLESAGVKNVVFEPSLARGLSYYTGPIFEVYAKNSGIASSCAGGGRYDRMIGQFLGSKQEVPAVGISFGLDVLSEILWEEAAKKTVSEAIVIPIGDAKEGLRTAAELRKRGVKTYLDLMQRSISKNLNYADKLGIPFAVIVGPDEAKEGVVKLRNMKTGRERLLKPEQAAEEIRKGRENIQ